ncbi:MAG TPA: thioredoxin domain-containing protein, partial [Allosphingosinicella sp.]|nr:thioredoxin domain-containing protein [Allosphingosinicella sp.]
MKLSTAGAVAALLILAGCGDQGGNASGTAPVLEKIAAPNNGDWTEIVSETPEGGYRMGNPEAPVKLVEYGSLSCSHCAEFAEQGSGPLRENYVKSGRVSWEFRPFLLFPSDPGVTMLLRCQGPSPFFQLADQLYADQATWMGALQTAAAAPGVEAQLQSMTPQQRAAVLVRMAGLEEFFHGRGMPQGRIDSCLADQKGLQDLLARSERATSEDGVQGTPTFFINGTVVPNAASWPALEPA